MENKKLIPLSDFVLEQQWNKNGSPKCDISERSQSWQLIVNYTEFLKQPLKLEMFVPCDEEGNILKEQAMYCFANKGSKHFEKHTKYWKAKDKVLFEFNYPIDFSKVNIEKCKTVEEFLNTTNIDIFLTPSSLKKIGIKE